MKADVQKFFERYASVFNACLGGDAGMDEAAALYAPEFIAASSTGVMTGKNDDQLKHVMAQGYARYRAMGMKQMRLRAIRLSQMDGQHCVAHVAWTAINTRKDRADVAIDFDVHYLVQMLNRDPKVFGWVSGDEQALLRKHGIVEGQ